MALKVTIEDTGVGVTFAGDPGKYRVWKATDPSGTEFLVTTRSVFWNGNITQPQPIDRYVEVTENMLAGTDGADELLAEIKAQAALWG